MRLRLYFESVLDDLRFAVRSFRRSPGFTLTALLAISLGVGASTAVFSVVDRVLFRPLPYENAGRLVSLGMVAKVVGENEFLFAADYKDLLESRTPFQAMTSWSGVSDCDLTDREPVRQQCAEVESNFLTVFGVKPLLGEGFRKEDGQPNAPSKAILSYGLWKSRFGGDRGIVGQTMQLDGKPERIAGVLPPSFELPTLQHADLLVPQVVLDSGWQHSATRVLWVFGQLRNGTTMKQALPQLAPAFERMRSYVPAPFRKQIQFRARTLRDRQMERATAAAWTSFGAVLAVLLISCANVANLLLARGVGRKAEIAVREALGAGRRAISAGPANDHREPGLSDSRWSARVRAGHGATATRRCGRAGRTSLFVASVAGRKGARLFTYFVVHHGARFWGRPCFAEPSCRCNERVAEHSIAPVLDVKEHACRRTDCDIDCVARLGWAAGS